MENSLKIQLPGFSSSTCPFQLAVALLALVWYSTSAMPSVAQVTWDIDNTDSIGGLPTTVIGNPSVVQTPFGNALRFDGNDGLIVDTNPIAGASSFTMEMLLRPDTNQNAGLDEPRILHVQSSAPNDHRAILEGRIQGNEWYLDGFLRAPNVSNPSTIGSLALIDPVKTHPTDRWYSYSMVYDGTELHVYLNGELELSGEIELLPLAVGQTSIGMRHNQVNFFSGDISVVRFTPSALAAGDLLSARIPGDFNDDYYEPTGGIDEQDLLVWQAQYGVGQPLPSMGDNADGDSDGDVDGSDFLIWQRAAEASLPAATHAVPEPVSFGSLAMILLISAGSRVRWTLH